MKNDLGGMIRMVKNNKKRAILILAVIIGIVSLITTVFVIVLGLHSKAEGYEILLNLSPMIIGLITGYYLLNRSYLEEWDIKLEKK